MVSPQGFVELSSSDSCPLESCSPLQMPAFELRVLGAEEMREDWDYFGSVYLTPDCASCHGLSVLSV